MRKLLFLGELLDSFWRSNWLEVTPKDDKAATVEQKCDDSANGKTFCSVAAAPAAQPYCQRQNVH